MAPEESTHECKKASEHRRLVLVDDGRAFDGDWVIFAVGGGSCGRRHSARGRKLQFSDRHFADTDGDGELEFVTYYPQVPSYRGGTSSETYKLQVYKLFDDRGPRWTFDTGMGTQENPSSGDFRADWDYEWTFKPVAWDIDGDYKAEIITLAKRGGKYRYVVLKDMGAGPAHTKCVFQ